MGHEPGRKIADATVSKKLATALAFVLMFAFGIPVFWFAAHSEDFMAFDGWSTMAMLIMVIAIGSIHELLHATGFIYWGKVPLNRFKFGFMWKALALYCHCKEPVTVRAYRVASLLPLFVLGILCVGALLLFPNTFTAFAVVFSIVGAVGDVMVFLKLRPFRAELIAKDHPTMLGLEIFEVG